MKKSNFILLSLIAVIVLAVASLTGCEDPEPEYNVKYEVTGPDSTVDHIIYFNETGAIDTINNIQIPWEKSFSVSGKNIGVGCSFTKYSSTDTYTVTIYVDGKMVKQASGPSTASATYLIP